MKNKLIIIPAVTFGCFCLALGANAQNPRPYPELHSGANAEPPQTKKAEKPASTATAKAGSKLSAKDKAFMMEAAKGGMAEVTWGQWASQKAQNADVKKFGSRMVADHSKWNNELM